MSPPCLESKHPGDGNLVSADMQWASATWTEATRTSTLANLELLSATLPKARVPPSNLKRNDNPLGTNLKH